MEENRKRYSERICLVRADDRTERVNPKEVFGRDTEYICSTMYKLMKVSFGHREYGNREDLRAKLYSVLKRHHIFATWYGDGECVHQPDRWEITQRGTMYLIQL